MSLDLSIIPYLILGNWTMLFSLGWALSPKLKQSHFNKKHFSANISKFYFICYTYFIITNWADNIMSNNMFPLLKARRFLPLFLTQFFEAFNDNFFKNALAILIAYSLIQNATQAEILVAVAGGIFILPFFLFSAIAGQLADRYDKAVLTRIIKIIEILAMCLGAVGFIYHNLTILLLTLFLIGTHSAFFGPIKYAILPDHLPQSDLIGANALIEASTFIAILIGTLVGGYFISINTGVGLVSFLGIVIAIIGLICSFFIPPAKPSGKQIKVSLNIFSDTKDIIQYAAKDYRIFLPILGISWFWVIGSIFIWQLPAFTKEIVGAQSHVVNIFLATFAIGITIGSFISDKVQHGQINATYVPLGIFGMTIFIFDTYFVAHNLPTTHNHLDTVALFFSHWRNWHFLIDILLLSISAGLFIVPLYAMIQSRPEASHRARIIAANNILNALFMVLAAAVSAIFLGMNMTIPQLFLLIGIINVGVAIYNFKLLPDAIIKSFVHWFFKTVYRVEVHGLENYAKASKRSIIVANHISFLDGLLLAAFIPDRAMFAINAYVAKRWWLEPVLKLVDAFPLDPTKPMSTKSLIYSIKNNRRCIIFPEGRLTVTGALMKIYEGPGMIADKADADIIPIRIDGAQYTRFSRLKGKVRIKAFPKITITILPPRKFSVPDQLKGRKRRQYLGRKFYDLMRDLMFESSNYHLPLFTSLIDAIKIHGRHHIILEDAQRKPMKYKSFLMRCFILGHYLAKHTQKNEITGILLPNILACAVSFFALHSHGRVPAMLNFSVGAKNIKDACQTAKINTVITARQFITVGKLERLITAMEELAINIIYLEDLATKINLPQKLLGMLMSWLPKTSFTRLNPKLKASDPAVVLFTSGSEGTPKGVVLSHENIQANRFQLSSIIDFSAQDIIFNALPLFHSFGLTAGFILPLVNGIRIFLYPSPLHYRIVPELVYDTNGTIMFGTDTFLAGYAKFANPYDFYSIRYVFAGAEKLKPQTRDIWINKFGLRIFEGYGATETAPVLSTNTPMHNKPGTVGRLLPKMEYKLQPVAGIDTGGRLIVSGPNIMKGYLLIANPGKLVPPPDDWYDTGDIVNVDVEGYITILGRAKRFAKIGGEMVSLTAVEGYIASLWPEFNHAIISIPETRKGEQLVLVTEHQAATKKAIKDRFQEIGLSELYLPKIILHINKMYLLGSGKIAYPAVQQYVIDTLNQ